MSELTLSLVILLILVIIIVPLIVISACVVGGRADRMGGKDE